MGLGLRVKFRDSAVNHGLKLEGLVCSQSLWPGGRAGVPESRAFPERARTEDEVVQGARHSEAVPVFICRRVVWFRGMRVAEGFRVYSPGVKF